jgi:asparagine synthase (glutamine-hydrolysing)
MYSALTMAWNFHAFEVRDREAAFDELEYRHPLNDRRLVEFGFALPETQKHRNGLRKFILREAVRGLTPDVLRLRSEKTFYTDAFFESFPAIGGEAAFRSLAAAGAGWVDGPAVQEMYRRMELLSRDGFRGPVTFVTQLWLIWAVSFWLQITSGPNNGGNTDEPTKHPIPG